MKTMNGTCMINLAYKCEICWGGFVCKDMTMVWMTKYARHEMGGQKKETKTDSRREMHNGRYNTSLVVAFELS